MNVQAIQQALTGVVARELMYLPSVGSTNDPARRLAVEGCPNGTAVITDYQAAGRGRRGRTWFAPAGSSLLLSMVLDVPSGAMAEVTMMAALSVADAVGEETGLEAELKWPNDLLVRGRKVAGILAESCGEGVRRAIVGVGINVNFDPAEHGLPKDTSSLRLELGRAVSREALAVRLFNRTDMWYRNLTRDADGVYAAWSSRLATVGKPVLVTDSSGTWRGIATGVGRDGALLVDGEDGKVRTFYAADVTLRGTVAFTSP